MAIEIVTISMAIFNSYVSLPEGTSLLKWWVFCSNNDVIATSLRRHSKKKMIGRIQKNTDLSESSLTLNMSMGQNLWDHNWEDYHSFYQLF